MSSTPLIASSSGVATVSAITFGLAPGYTVRTTTDGGTTFGYSPIGSSGIEIRPAAKITIDSTAAKIGRSMKNLEKSMRSEEHTSELQSLMRISYAVFRLKKKNNKNNKSCRLITHT